MAELTQLQQQMMEHQRQFEEMQKRMKELKIKNKKYEYKGPQLQVKLQISEKRFISSTTVLCNKQNGNNMFIHTILGVNIDNNEEGDDSKSNGLTAKIIESQKNGTSIELFFDRDPHVFPLVLMYLRGYTMQPVFNDLSVGQLQALLDDAHYYRISGLVCAVSNSLYNRFDPLLCAPSITLSNNGIGITRTSVAASYHHSCGVYGVLRKGKRYIEFQVMSQATRNIMFGVTEADCFLYASYPGHGKVKGLSYYCANGNCYRGGGSEAWGAGCCWMDRLGILVDISNDLNTATIAFYLNDKLVKQPRNLKDYMDISKGVVFVANLHSANEQVVIMQNTNIPQ